MSPGMALTYYVLGVLVGVAIGAASAVLVIMKRKPEPAVILVTPEAIARWIAAGGGIHCSTPPVLVDWSVIHKIIESEGYVLIGKDEPGAPRRH